MAPGSSFSFRKIPLGAILALGVVAVFAVGLGFLVYREWRVNHIYTEMPCVVLGKRLGETHDPRDNRPTSYKYRPEIQARYAVEGRAYTVWTYDAVGSYSSSRSGQESILEQFVVGKEYPLWYDPDDPEKAVLVRGYSWVLYGILVVLVAALVVALVIGVRALRQRAAGKLNPDSGSAPGQSG